MQSNQQAFKDYLQMQKNYSLHTVKAYVKDIEEFDSFNKIHFEQDSIDIVGYSQIRSWIVSLVDGNISASSGSRQK